MKPKKVYLMLTICLFLILAIGGVSAQNMTITDLGYTGPQTIQVYNVSGVLLGTYNTTTNGIVLPTTDFVLVIKPDAWNQDLGQSLTAMMAWLAQYWYVIVIVLGMIILATRRW